MADRKVRIALLGVDPATRVVLESLEPPPGMRFFVVHEGSMPAGPDAPDSLPDLQRSEAEIVILELGNDPAGAIEYARKLADRAPGLTLMATGPDLVPEVLLKAMRAGISEYLPRPVAADELASGIQRTVKRSGGGRDEDEAEKEGKVFAFLPVKGGTGTTTAAVNMAVEVQRATGERTILVDLDLEMGGVALLLGIRPRFSFLDLARNFHRLDAGLINSYVERHPSGLHVMAAPLRPERSDVITAEEAARIISFLGTIYRYVVIDMSKSLSPMTLAVLEQADLIIAVTTADLPTLGSLKRLMPVLERLGPDTANHVRVVLNRYHPEGAVTIDDVRTLLEMDVHWTLSNDYKAVIRAANEGKPIALNGRSPYARDIGGMVGDLVDVGDGAAEEADGGLSPFRRLFGRKVRN